MTIDNIIIEFDYFKVSFYSFFYLLSATLALIFGRFVAIRSGIDKDTFMTFFFIAIFALILGGRLGHTLFFQWHHYSQNPLEILQVWRGGMSFHGALLMGTLSIAGYAYYYRLSFRVLADFIVLWIPIAVFFGRIGNFLNNELWGQVPKIAQKLGEGQYQNILPTISVKINNQYYDKLPIQLYEAFFEGVVLCIIIWTLHLKKVPKGVCSAIFLIGYGGFRFILEFFKPPDIEGYILHIFTLGQLFSLIMFVIGFFWWWRLKAKV